MRLSDFLREAIKTITDDIDLIKSIFDGRITELGQIKKDKHL